VTAQALYAAAVTEQTMSPTDIGRLGTQEERAGLTQFMQRRVAKQKARVKIEESRNTRQLMFSLLFLRVRYFKPSTT
jgi:GGDEF domain-containing protein